jgi:multidrug efflux pump subunit AcrB
LQAGLEIDRVRAAAMGVTPLAVDNTLYDAFGQRQVRTIYLPHNFSRVVLEAGPAMQADPASLNSVYVPGTAGGQVPLAALTRVGRSHGAMWMVHSGQFPAVTISFDTVPGVSIGQAIASIRALERSLHLPDDIHAEFRGEAGEATKTGTQQMFLFLAAIFAVYVVLGVLYESYAHPFTILTTLPPAIFGALLALRIVGIEFTLITTIGCILLVGMVMKNAIMLVDFALQAERQDGLAPIDAIVLAARQRVRPIVMTTCVAVLSAVPLAVGTGPGFELRQPLGVSIVGGLLASQLLTLYTTPVIYLLVGRLRRQSAARPAI